MTHAACYTYFHDLRQNLKLVHAWALPWDGNRVHKEYAQFSDWQGLRQTTVFCTSVPCFRLALTYHFRFKARL
jgi:hypothetical protein